MSIFRNIVDLIGNAMPANTSTYTAPAQPVTYNVRGVTLTDQDIAALRNTLFAEISNRTPDKQRLEARTIINTALNRLPQYQNQGGRYKDMTFHDVLKEPNQYQGYGSAEYQRLANASTTPVDQQKINAIDDVIKSLKANQLEDNTGGMVYYSHQPDGRILLKEGTLFKQPKKRPTIADLQ